MTLPPDETSRASRVAHRIGVVLGAPFVLGALALIAAYLFLGRQEPGEGGILVLLVSCCLVGAGIVYGIARSIGWIVNRRKASS